MTPDHSFSAIKREADQLVDLQIETMRRRSSLTSSQLAEYHVRFEKIRALYRQLDQIASAKIARKFPQAA
jgi:hypothetical protein